MCIHVSSSDIWIWAVFLIKLNISTECNLYALASTEDHIRASSGYNNVSLQQVSVARLL